ncbi:MAG: hypothetical protein HY040_09405 [Planctomycetes bacterium]|nr:hypothetical protein [Planctomycetota bacterium]
MKKILASILCLAFVFSLTLVTVGCGGAKEEKKAGTTGGAKETAEKPKETK